ncbi:MAG: hypothetical protein JKX76_02260 [Colwellia sp.]|nr:hypothetical protein [Colwellia sp.]
MYVSNKNLTGYRETSIFSNNDKPTDFENEEYRQSNCNLGNDDPRRATHTAINSPKTNYGVSAYNTTKPYGCVSSVTYATEQQPRLFNDSDSEYQRIILNKKIGLTSSSDFYQLPGGTYAAYRDPRLIDNRTGIYQDLDQPPLVGTVPEDQIYSDELTDYGKNYNTYSDITAGQIQYYYSKDIAAAYSTPNFSLPANVEKQIFIDPMDQINPRYNRQVLLPNAKNIGCNQEARDTVLHREDLMSKQMARRNETDWQARYS